MMVMDYKCMKQKEFSEDIGVPRSSLSEILSGKRCPNIDVIVGISTRFKDINIEWVLTGDGEMVKNKAKEESPTYQTKSIAALESLFDRVDDLEKQVSEMRKQA